MKLSIITINFNNLEGLKGTLESVVLQTWQGFEFIVIDGGSTDGSAEYIETQSKYFDYWVSEPDEGIYNAMNKGIAAAKGEYLLFLNSGDYLVNKILSAIDFSMINEDVVYFDLIYLNHEVKHIQKYPDKLTFRYLSTFSLPHQASFIKKDLFNKYCYYDESFKIISDWAFFLIALAKYNASYRYIPKPFAFVDRNGISCDPKNNELVSKERQKFLTDNFSFYLEDYRKANDLEESLKKIESNLLYRIYIRLSKFFK
jgi:glycosyltransferase involved in cell wall biosynthesis